MHALLFALFACAPAPAPTPLRIPDPPAAPAPPPEPQPKIVTEADARPPTIGRFAASHILVSVTGAIGAAPDVQRSDDEARALATSLWRRAQQEPFGALAREHSEDRTRNRDGRLGVFNAGTFAPSLEAAIAETETGQVGPIARSPFGWHVVRREPVPEVTVAAIIVTWKGAVAGSAPRSQSDARERAEVARAELQAGTPFTEVASRLSDGPKDPHASLGLVARGQLAPALEAAAFALVEDGAVSPLIETPTAYYVLVRTGAPAAH
jgi:parvulin-like peptidyl-prolyl isomerase